jgi:hypothetical protein
VKLFPHSAIDTGLVASFEILRYLFGEYLPAFCRIVMPLSSD